MFANMCMYVRERHVCDGEAEVGRETLICDGESAIEQFICHQTSNDTRRKSLRSVRVFWSIDNVK